MSLNWDTRKVKYFEDHPDDLWIKVETDGGFYDDLNGETKSLVFATMYVGIGNLTYDKLPEFFARQKVTEDLTDTYLYSAYDTTIKDFVKYGITPSVLIKHMNLSTNVAYESQTDWVDKLVKIVNRDYRKPGDQAVTKANVVKKIKEYKQLFLDSI